ncbi:MAG: hypothetical protein K2L07_05765 [Lachnospiraceae bacterium]|nr:hypothetical protein [Lachnospiraceae bacterium]
MKKYLVAYNVHRGLGLVKSAVIEVEDDYVPALDNMKKIKKKIISDVKPELLSLYAAPSNCGGDVLYTEDKLIDMENLNIVAISNLNV